MIQYKLEHENAKKPVKGSELAAGFDLYAAEILRENEYEVWYNTGVAFEIPQGIYGDLRARSSVSETGLILANGCGVLDPDYTGTIQFRFYKHKPAYDIRYIAKELTVYRRDIETYNVGERIGQIIFSPYLDANLEETDEIKETKRGENGFGSSGFK